MHRSKASDVSVEYVGDKSALRTGDPAVLFRKTGLPVLRRILAEHELDDCPRRVMITAMFTKPSGRIPEWSGVLPAEHGVRFRIQGDRSTDGFLGVLLCCDGETPAGLLESLLESDKADLAPSDPAIVAAAAAMAKELSGVPSASLDAFAGLVMDKAGTASRTYWMDALCEAERQGLLWRDGKRFNPPYEPEEEKPKPAKSLIEAPLVVSAKGIRAAVGASIGDSAVVGVADWSAVSHIKPAQRGVARKATEQAAEAVDELLANPIVPAPAADPDEEMADDAERLLEVLGLIKQLNAERKSKRELRKELAGELAAVDSSLAKLDESIRKTRARLDSDALLRLAESADTSKGTP